MLTAETTTPLLNPSNLEDKSSLIPSIIDEKFPHWEIPEIDPSEGLPTDGTFKSIYHNLDCMTFEAKPLSSPKAMVIYLHGLGGHSRQEMFIHLASVMTKSFNIIYRAFDYYGNGLSQGYNGLANSYGDIADTVGRDIISFIDLSIAKYPDLPFFVMGNSLGGALTILTINNIQSIGYKDFVGSVLLCPALDAAVIPPACIEMLLRCCFVPLCPDLSTPIGYTGPDKCVREGDDARAARGFKDPLLWKTGQRMASGVKLVDFVRSLEGLIDKIHTPFLIIHGTGDRVIHTTGTERLFIKSKTDNNHKFKYIIKDAPHELLNDDSTPLVIRLIESFVKRMIDEYSYKQSK